MPDERPFPSSHADSDADPKVDSLYALAEFVRELPAWTGADGYPLSWPHFVYGMRSLGLAETARLAHDAEAAHAAGYVAADFKRWTHRVTRPLRM